MAFGQLNCERQTEPGPIKAPGKAAIHLPERLNCVPDVLSRHSNSRVFDLQAQSVFVLSSSEGDRSAGWGELDRIRQQIDDNLLEFRFISVDRDAVAGGGYWRRKCRP
jgi:hypothetical protein